MNMEQGICSINDIPACREVIEQTIAEAEEAMGQDQVKY